MGALGLLLAAIVQLQTSATIEVVVATETGPLSRAQVVVKGRTLETGADGRVRCGVETVATYRRAPFSVTAASHV